MLTNKTRAMLCGMAVLLSISLEVSACSNVFMTNANPDTGEVYASVARCMDFELYGGNIFGYGLPGDDNTSNINMQSNPINHKDWITAYGFIGQTLLGTCVINDGVNTEGLYAGMLALPGFTQYPEYNPADERPEMGVMELATYALGTVANVSELLDVDKMTGKLIEVQIVGNAAEIDEQFTGFAGHFTFHDKKGDSLVVEFVKGQTHFYSHRAGESTIVEIIDVLPKYRAVYNNTEGAVLTNAPTYSWHLKMCSTRQYSKFFDGNTNKKWNGAFMNGSGLVGLPGDFTPPSRFARATTLARLFPKPMTQDDAMFASYTVLQSVIVPPGVNPSATNFITWVDLKNSIFNFKPLFLPIAGGSNPQISQITLITSSLYEWKTFDCKKIINGDLPVPVGWNHIKVSQGRVLSEAYKQKILNDIATPTPGNMVQEVEFNEDQ